MRKILFLRNIKKPDQVRGHDVKVKDYFAHCLQHPRLLPYVYFSPGSRYQESSLWAGVPTDSVVDEIQIEPYDMIFVSGRDWTFLPEMLHTKITINLIQHVRHADKNDDRFPYLNKPAFRICVSQEIYQAIAPYINGVAVVINNAIPLEIFETARKRPANSITIWAGKNPGLGKKLYAELTRRGVMVGLIIDCLPRHEFARRMQESDIFVTLPNETEGFYLPALEGMASGCAVVCSDAVGNRSFCFHGQTCLMPRYDHFNGHLKMIEQLLVDGELKERIRRGGIAMAQSYSLQNEREQFYCFLDTHIFSDGIE